MVIWALKPWREVLYLEDDQIQQMLLHLRGMITQFEETHGNLERLACAGEQWHSLRVLCASAEKETGPLVERQEVVRKRISHRERASVNYGFYEPNSKVKALTTIHRDRSNARIVACTACGHQIQSEWFYKHPLKQNMVVLVPSHGHEACRKKSVKSQYKPLDGSKSCGDQINDIAFCVHNILKKACKTCNLTYLRKYNQRRSQPATQKRAQANGCV
eukprot:TRINITY_DN49403_c0_g1_i1.p1 TRINITY_DN49403_c0_g1~~TRINITY_DN49403_c0_g1_i1.p1  ORF type:complete len:217 (+),score=19.51 TRINITY_DN49403_c0_g1_i1:85-735(+)